MASKRGKRFREAYERIDRTRHYEPAEAVALLKQTAGARFDETVEVHIRLGVNVRHAEEQLRGTLALPNGAGRDVTVAVFAEGDKAREATEAGAEFVGSDELAERVEAGWTDFDIVIATPDQMPKVGRLGRILGPQGKMPNPKVGTVTDDVTKAVSETKSGKIEYRTDRQAVVHLSIGKASLHRAGAARELRRGHRRDRPRQAGRGEGPLHPLDHAGDDDGPGRPRRLVPHARGRDPRRRRPDRRGRRDRERRRRRGRRGRRARYRLIPRRRGERVSGR